MCGLCGIGDAARVIFGGDSGNHASLWPKNAAQILAEQGLVIADADSLFSSKAAQVPTDDGEISFNSFFDVPSGIGTPYGINVGQRLNGEISTLGDTDWFGMLLQAGQTYQISLKALPFGGLGDAQVFLFDDRGNFLLSDDDSGDNNDALMTFTATRDGVYYTGATGFGKGGSTVGTYELSLGVADFNADTVGDIPALAGSLDVGASINGRIDFSFDEDWYAVTVEEGKTYAVFLESSASSFTPLGDPNLEVVDRRLAFVAENDDNGITRNSALTFTADYDGVYYVKAKGGPGNTGDFRLTVADFSPPEPPSPVDGIDWGVKLDDPNVTFYFAKAGEVFGDEFTEIDWNAYEKGQAKAALNEFTKISKLSFTEVTQSSTADFILTKSFQDGSTTGRMIPPDDAFGNIQGVGWFNTKPEVWSREAGGFLERGAFGYSNFIHEFGHGLGLSHPHDDGGTSFVFAGVRSSGDVGDNQLNQEVFTVMSYNKGWRTGPNGSSQTDAFGIARTPMAFDIAKIQEKYGANTTHNQGKTTYALFTENKVGTGYDAIWDTGGKDTIVNPGSVGATIDLREATLKAEAGGGGFVSFVTGVFGGYTIANGVVIENARGGSSGDTLVGNDANNLLDGRGGKDVMLGGKGNDKYVVDDAGDVVNDTGNDAKDWVMSAILNLDLKNYDEIENINLQGDQALNATGSGEANQLKGNTADNVLKGKGGADTLKGAGGQDKVIGGGGNDTLRGDGGNDTLRGGGGSDRVEGGGGNDLLAGNKGGDNFVFKGKFGADIVKDFKSGTDTLTLSQKLWSGKRSEADVVSEFADVSNGQVVFDFGSGNTITLSGLKSVAGLEDDIAFI
ncbi:MAG: M10 family metallopeptidase [Arenibacterium sp.]